MNPPPQLRTLLALAVLAPASLAQIPTTPEQQLAQLTAAQQLALSSGDPAQVLATSRPLAALAFRLVGDLYLRNDNLDLATRALAQSFDLDPDPATATQLISTDLLAGHTEAAAHITQQLTSAVGDTPRLHIVLAEAHHTAADLPGTIAELTRATTLDPTFGPAHLALGSAFWELNEFGYNSESLREFTAAQRLSPADFLSNLDLGTILSQYQRFAEAAPFLHLAAAADPGSPDPWLQLGMDAYLGNNPAEAQVDLEKAVTLTGSDHAHNSFSIRRAYAVLSHISAVEGRPEEASRLAAQNDLIRAELVGSGLSSTLSQSTSPLGGNSTPTAHLSRQPSAPASTPLTEPEQQLQHQLESIAARSLNDAGTALARGHDYTAALPLFRQAAAADPSLVPVMRNLGLAAFHTGAYPEAIAALTEALHQDPADTLARNYLTQSQALAKP